MHERNFELITEPQQNP